MNSFRLQVEDRTWVKHSGVGATGAVLVRPDGFVLYLFRNDTLARELDVTCELTKLMKSVLWFKM
jgi:hypothetical protein